MRISKMITLKRKALIIYQILSTNALTKIMYGDQSREFVFENNFELQRPALASGAQSKAWQAWPSTAMGRLARKVWPGKVW